MKDKCINISNSIVINIAKELNIPPYLAAAKISAWQNINGDKIPTVSDLTRKVNYQLPSTEGQIASEKTIRDLAARMSDRIGMPIRFESDRTKDYKGKIENNVAYINLAYATLDTPIHEILGHPIIRAIKNKQFVTKRQQFNFNKPFFNNQDVKNNTGKTITHEGHVYEVYELKKFSNITYKAINFKRNEEIELSEKEFNDIVNESQLYQNLLKELETGKGKEVLDRIKRDYKYKENGSPVEYSEFDKELGKPVKKFIPGIEYTLEEQQEEAIVELLGLMTAEKLNAVKDGKLISLLKRLLKEMKAFMKQLLGQKEIEIDKLPDNMTLGDLSDLLAYSNSKLILPGYEVLYTTPDNQQFKTYQEASNHISELAKSVEDVDLDKNISVDNIDKEIETLQKELDNFKFEIEPFNKFTDVYTKKGRLRQNYWARKKDGTTGWTGGSKETLIEPEYDGFVLDIDRGDGRFITKISDKEAEELYYAEENKFNTTTKASREKYAELETKIHNLKNNSLKGFIEKNKEYEQSKEIIEEWKKVNNIQYNPEEIYSRGQEFSSVVGAYSDFDVNLMMQNLLQHIEDNEKAGGKFAISAYTKPVDKQLGHLEGGGGKIKFKIYPKSEDILWASNTDVYSGSVWDASEKVNKDKKSELLGVSYTKYPSLSNVNTVQPNLASIVDDLAHHHNELGIVLTGNNFRLEYDEDIPYQTKKIIIGINKILDQKYDKLVKPEIKQKQKIKDLEEILAYYNGNIIESPQKIIINGKESKSFVFDISLGKKFKSIEEAEEFRKSHISELKSRISNDLNIEIPFNAKKDFFESLKGIQPTQTNETLKESIGSVKNKLKGSITDEYGTEYKLTAVPVMQFPNNKIGDIIKLKGYDYKILAQTAEQEDWDGSIEPEMWKIEFVKIDSKKEYTQQALINTKIAALKEVAKKYPRSLIRSEVTRVKEYYPGEFSGFAEGELPFQKIPFLNKQNEIINKLDKLQNKVTKVDEQYQIEGFAQEWVRASTVAKKKIQNRTFAKLTEEDEELNNMRTQAGTIIHAIQANYIKKMFPEANKHLADTVIPIELKDLETAIEEQLKPYVEAAKAKGSVIKAEVFVANAKTGIAGTIDLLEITKEGTYIIYDLKNRFTKDETATRRFNKIGEWTDQTIEYKKILEEGDKSLGIMKGEVEGVFILELEVLPTRDGVFVSSGASMKGNLNLEQRAAKFLKYRKLNKIKVVAPFFLRTKDIKLDLMIDSLMAQIEKIKALKPKGEIEQQTKENLLESKIELMQSIQLKKDINSLIDNAYNDLTQIEKLIEDKTIGENDQIVKEQLELYSNILEYVDYKELDKIQLEQLKNVKFLADTLVKKREELGKEIIVDSSKSTGFAATLIEFGKDLFGAVKDPGTFRKLTMGISTVDNPLIQNAFIATREALAKSRALAQKLADKVVEARKKLVEQLGSANFEMMINYDKDGVPVLVQEFQYEFFRLKRKADMTNDLEWLSENVTYDQQSYLEAREKQLDYLDAYRKTNEKKIAYLNPELTEAEVVTINNQQDKLKMQKWDSSNKGSLIKHFKPKVKWRDSKWEDIKMGKYKGTAVEEFYDLYYTTLELARQLQPNDIHKNFIPNFSKSFIDRTMQNGLAGAIKEWWSGLGATLELDFDREAYSSTDSVTGEIINTMYIPGTSKQNAKDKSTDLAAGLFMFMEGVYRYNELKDVEQVVLETKRYLKNKTKFVKIDSLGRVVEGKEPSLNVNSNSFEMFSSWVDGVYYGIRTKNETAFEIKGNGFTELFGLLKKGETKKISYAKIVDKILGYTSLRNLGFSMYAPIVNLLSGSANMYMTGAGGVYYSNKDMSKALGLVLGGKSNFPNADVEKARLIVDWLDVDTSEFKKNVEEELSSYKIKRLLAKYNMLSIMNLSESVLRDSGAIAMVLSGKHKYKWEDFTVVDGKLVVNTDLLSKEVFRQKVIAVNQKNIGGINPDDMMMAKQYITGRILMQHRSWLPALAINRFGSKQFDYNLGKDIEGRYITAFRLFKYLTFQKNIRELSEIEQENLKAARVEVAMILGTGLLLAFMKAGFDDDDKKEAWYKVTKKINSRVFSELIFFADPTFQNQYQILLSPAASAGTIEDVAKFLGSSFTEITEKDEKKLERNKPGQKAFKLIPGSKVYTFIEDLSNEEKK